MQERLQRYNLVRLLIALAILGWAVGLTANGDETVALRRLFGLAAIALAVLLVTTIWAARREVGNAFAYGQFAADVALASVLSALTGGSQSIVSLLYFPAIAGAAYLQGARGSLAVAGMATVGRLAMLGWTERGPLADEAALLLYSNAVIYVLAFFLVATLSGRLAEAAERSGTLLRHERATSEMVLDRVRAGVLTTDDADAVVGINPAARLLLGDVVGKRLPEVFGGSIHHRAWEEERPDRRRWICSQAGLPSGGRVVVVEDVTELLEMRERAARDERLVAAGRVAASMAHEIRNPLASLTGSLELIRDDHPSRLVELALEEATRLNRLVEEFLDSSRVPSLHRELVDVCMIAEGVAEAFSRDPRFADAVRVVCVGEPADAWVDRDRIRQTLWNLVLNGAQAMPRGGEIRIDVEPSDGGPAGVTVRVVDEGVGIPSEDLDRVFDPFYTRRAGGSGLGLALVDQVVRGHGGSVSVALREHGGTQFTLWLPREESLAV